MLSRRGIQAAASQDIPWRFAPGGNNRYDKNVNPTGVVTFGMAENSLVHEELEKYVAENVKIPAAAFTYGFSTYGGPRFPIALANHLQEYFNPFSPVNPDHILTSAGLTAMHALLGHNLGDAGDGILVSRPIYGRFGLDFGNTADLKIVYAEMQGTDPFEVDVVQRYQKALEDSAKDGVHVKALLIVNPHNPLGRCYPPETLTKIMRFCEQNKIHLISDEVYALSVYDTINEDAPKFTSVLSFDPKKLISTDRLHVIYGLSKDFAAAGIRLGSVITKNEDLRKAIKANLRFHGASGMSVAIGTAILEDRKFVAEFIALCRKRLSDAYAYTTGVFNDAGIEYHKGGNAGFFLYINLGPWLPQTSEKDGNEREHQLAQKLLDGGVGLHPCEEHNEERGWFRLVFSSQDREALEVGLTRLISILGAKQAK